jgi:hypothetical protein
LTSKINTKMPEFSLRRQLLAKRDHCGLTRGFVVVSRRAILVVAEGEHPYPRRSDRRGVGLKNAADNSAIGEHVEVVIVPIAFGG